ncbi:MAG TPA: transporter substrate-binding protein [Bryobacteraceae bacterium]|nr:transporter substrate-binding protein [Bryobacteraceae bacterium]
MSRPRTAANRSHGSDPIGMIAQSWKSVGFALLTSGAALVAGPAAEDPVKVGVLHSLTGTMASSETSLRDMLLFAFDEINAQGGVLGRKIEPIVLDGGSNVGLFAEKAGRLLDKDQVAVIFGCWTSASRKAVIPILEKRDGLLVYPVQYEGEEESPNVCYAGETVNQQAIPAVDYLLAKGFKRFYLLGSDYVYPRTTNLVLAGYLLGKGVPGENIGGGIRRDDSGRITSAGRYTPLGHTDYQRIVAEIKAFAAGGHACVINTLNGDTNASFFQEYLAAGLTARSCPMMSFSIAEDELRYLPAPKLAGQLCVWSYFQSLATPGNRKFLAHFRRWLDATSNPSLVRRGRVVDSPMVLSYDGVYLWKACVEKAGTFNVDRVREVWQSGVAFDGPGGEVTTQRNMHLTKSVYVGEIQPDGQFTVLQASHDIYAKPWQQGTPVPAAPRP